MKKKKNKKRKKYQKKIIIIIVICIVILISTGLIIKTKIISNYDQEKYKYIIKTETQELPFEKADSETCLSKICYENVFYNSINNLKIDKKCNMYKSNDIDDGKCSGYPIFDKDTEILSVNDLYDSNVYVYYNKNFQNLFQFSNSIIKNDLEDNNNNYSSYDKKKMRKELKDNKGFISSNSTNKNSMMDYTEFSNFYKNYQPKSLKIIDPFSKIISENNKLNVYNVFISTITDFDNYSSFSHLHYGKKISNVEFVDIIPTDNNITKESDKIYLIKYQYDNVYMYKVFFDKYIFSGFYNWNYNDVLQFIQSIHYK